MHIASYFEEDFRLATSLQVRNYTPEERQVRPHLPGFALIQLLDQLDGHVLSTAHPRFLIHAPGGTAYWLIRHLGPRAGVQLWLPPGQCSESSRHLLTDVLMFDELESSQDPPLVSCAGVTCTVLACLPEDLVSRYICCCQNPLLGRRPILAYDPERRLKQHPEGEYFLNSSIWVTRDHGD